MRRRSPYALWRRWRTVGQRTSPGPFIVVAGNIGSGKSTAVAAVSAALGMRAYHEGVDRNPYFSDFYAEPRQWALQSQLSFMTMALADHLDIGLRGGPAIQDRGVHEMHQVFNAAQLAQGNLTHRDHAQLAALIEAVEPQLARPTLLLYLHAPVEELLGRIHRRGREAETAVSEQYLDLLEDHYQAFADRWVSSDVLRVDTSICDVRTQEGQAALVSRVVSALTAATRQVPRASRRSSQVATGLRQTA